MLNKTISSVSPSVTLSLNAKARELKMQGQDVINLTIGEPDWPSAESVKEGGITAIRNNFTRYTDVPGILDLRAAVAHYYRYNHDVPSSSENVLISNGGKQILAMLFAILLEKNDEVIIPTPYWTSYPEQVKLAGGVPVFVDTDDTFIIRASAIHSLVGDRTRIIIINSPSNPTGAIVPKDELEKILHCAQEKNLLIISDEVYSELYYREKPCSIASLEQKPFTNVIIAASLSKMSSMTGWRIGFALASYEIIGALNTYQSHFSSAPNAPAQRAAVAAFSADSLEYTARMREDLRMRRELLIESFQDIRGISLYPPMGAFYGWLRTGDEILKNTGDNFCAKLLDETLVAVVPGNAFGKEYSHMFRITFAVSRELLKAAAYRIREFAQKNR